MPRLSKAVASEAEEGFGARQSWWRKASGRSAADEGRSAGQGRSRQRRRAPVTQSRTDESTPLMPRFGVRKGRRPNKGFQRTALGAERDRGYFDSWNRPD